MQIHKKNPCWYGARVYDKLGKIVENVSKRLGKNYKNSYFKNAGTHIFKEYLNLSSDISANIIASKAIKYSNKDPKEIKKE